MTRRLPPTLYRDAVINYGRKRAWFARSYRTARHLPLATWMTRFDVYIQHLYLPHLLPLYHRHWMTRCRSILRAARVAALPAACHFHRLLPYLLPVAHLRLLYYRATPPCTSPY